MEIILRVCILFDVAIGALSLNVECSGEMASSVADRIVHIVPAFLCAAYKSDKERYLSVPCELRWHAGETYHRYVHLDSRSQGLCIADAYRGLDISSMPFLFWYRTAGVRRSLRWIASLLLVHSFDREVWEFNSSSNASRYLGIVCVHGMASNMR